MQLANNNKKTTTMTTTINKIDTKSFEFFVKQNTNGRGRKEARFIEAYGDVSFEQAYPIYVAEITERLTQAEKIKAFENYLLSLGVEEIKSNVSESRYYNYQGMKYRFSSHVYPTGSMTNENTIDFAADPQLIETIIF